jgi:rRNA processing protein Krr1/Pno1
VRIEFKSEPVISEGKITIEDNVISLLGSTIEVDGLRAIVELIFQHKQKNRLLQVYF